MSVPPRPTRADLRAQLLAARDRFALQPAFAEAEVALVRELVQVVNRLEPECLGVYWAVRSEFNAAVRWKDDSGATTLALALPFARRAPREMHYRRWDGLAPRGVDECGIATSDGEQVVPDVVLVPCVGFTAAGYRLGYGGGYFDRWLAAHPHVTAVGVAWWCGEMRDDDFAPEPHDQPLALVVTERGVV